jgi:hypothetical protein
VGGLKQSMGIAPIGRGGHSHASHQRRRQVGKDVAEHIFGDDHIERVRTLHQVEGGRIDVDLVGSDVRKRGGNLVKYRPKEDHRRKHIGLVD